MKYSQCVLEKNGKDGFTTGNMKRYKDTISEMVEHPKGQWVKFEDVESVFDKIIEIMNKGTPNRRYGLKVWEQKIVDLIDREIG